MFKVLRHVIILQWELKLPRANKARLSPHNGEHAACFSIPYCTSYINVGVDNNSRIRYGIDNKGMRLYCCIITITL